MTRQNVQPTPLPTLRESAGVGRDDASAAREVAGTRRDRIGDERDVAGDERDDNGGRQDRLADRRDREGDRRDEWAHVRDVLAEQRDRDGVQRDQVADHRDKEADRRDEQTGPEATGASDRLVAALAASARDRLLAAEDREAGARERALSREDRDTAVSDRSAAATERSRAQTNRSVSADDRASGATERRMSRGDRTSSRADRTASAAERQSSYLDDLTGVYSRGAGLIELRHEIDRCQRENHSLVLAFVDADHLKAINDAHGHAAGDHMLAGMATALVTSLRSYDLIMRYGGDEFVCAMSNVSTVLADKRMQYAASLSAEDGADFTYGLSELTVDDTAETLICRADAVLYSKRRGRKIQGSSVK